MTTTRRHLGTLFFLAILLFVPAALLGRSAPAWDEPFADAGRVRAEADALAPIDPDADVEILLQESVYTFDDEGGNIFRHRVVYRLLSSAGIEAFSTTEMEWSPWYQDRPRIRARVLSRDGREHWLDEATLHEAPVHEDQPEVMSDRRVLRAPLPALAAGVVVEEESVLVSRATLPGAGSVHRLPFAHVQPVHHTRLEVDAPADLPLSFHVELLPEVSLRQEDDGGRVRHVYEGGPFDPVDHFEPLAPGDASQWPMVSFSTAESWGAVARAFHDVVREQLRTDAKQADLKKVVRPLVRQEKSRQAKNRQTTVDRLLAWLQAEIRYTGLEFAEAAIVPRPPAETLKRHYGDCKDKAALLVALLHEAGIPAHLAMLNAGFGNDVRPELPGFGAFNHAIVYVPGDGGEEGLWIDPTDEMARAGEVPVVDQGRWALIAAPDTEKLVQIPAATSADNRIVELRTVTLNPDLGGGRVVEVTRAWGSADRDHRSSFGRLDAEARRKALETYVQGSFLAEELTDYAISNLGDVTEPFELTTTSENARMANTDVAEAFVVLRPGQLLDRLPRALLRGDGKDEKEEEKDEATEGDDEEGFNGRRLDLVLPEPYSAELRYVVHPPPGYRAIELPEAETREIGPAVYELEVLQDEDGEGPLELVLRFDTRKRRLSPDEVRALRRDARDFLQEGPVVLRFENRAEALLAAGDVRGALAEVERLVNLRPEKALPHVRRSRALLAAGFGRAARVEADRAARLEDDVSLVHQNRGWVLLHDEIGRHLEGNFDLDGAIAAYRRAKELDPENELTRQNLAIALEHDADGGRYSDGARLDEAIEEYEALLELSDNPGSLSNNYLLVLLRAGRFAEVLEKVEDDMGSASFRPTVRLAAIAAEEGGTAAIRAATRISDREERQSALVAAAQTLSRMRLYSEAAALLREGARGQRNATALLGHAETLAKTERFEEMELGDDPESLVRTLLVKALLGDDEELAALYSQHLQGSKHVEDEIEQIHGLARALGGTPRDGTPLEGVADVLVGGLQVSKNGVAEIGYRVQVLWQTGRMNGDFPVYVVAEDGGYRLLTLQNLAPLGSVALRALDAGALVAARQWLDWAREATSLPSADDPFAGAPSARFWTRGEAGDEASIRDAAAALAASGPDAEAVLPILLEGREKAADDAKRRAFDLALGRAYFVLDRHADLEPLARAWIAERPDSEAAFSYLTWSLNGLERWDDLRAAGAARLAELPDDEMAIRVFANADLGQARLQEAQGHLRRLIELGKANAGDFNDLAWHDVMRGTVTEESLEHAQRAVNLSDYRRSGVLHTLASVYAELERGAEAREVLLQSMSVDAYDEPRSEDWYVWGRIAESYGITDAAVAAYELVEPPDKEWEIALSSWQAAQRRLKALARTE